MALLVDARQSGMSLDRYAKMNGLTPSMLYRWQKQFADQLAECPADPLARQPKFAAVKIDDMPSTSQQMAQTQASPLASKDKQNFGAYIEIVLRNGRILRVTPPIDLDVMTRLADALEAAA